MIITCRFNYSERLFSRCHIVFPFHVMQCDKSIGDGLFNCQGLSSHLSAARVILIITMALNAAIISVTFVLPYGNYKCCV